jgi:hypothetical protein
MILQRAKRTPPASRLAERFPLEQAGTEPSDYFGVFPGRSGQKPRLGVKRLFFAALFDAHVFQFAGLKDFAAF